MPRVSVVLPVHDGARFLRDALQSVFVQGDAIGEVLLVDDGSTDAIGAALEPFRARVRYVRQEHRGPSAARNVGLALAREAYIAFLDADDIWPAGAISRMLRLMSGGSEVFGAHGLTRLYTRADTPRRGDEHARQVDAAAPTGEHWAAIREAWRSPQLGSIVVTRRLFERVACFDESLRQGEDFDWFVRLRDAGIRLEPLNEVVLLYRLHERNTSRALTAESRNTFLVLRRSLERRARRERGQP